MTRNAVPRSLTISASVGAALLGAGQAAQAAPFSFNSNLLLPQYVSTSSPVNGVFDAGSALSGMEVTSGSISAFFNDDSDPFQLVGTNDTGWIYDGSSSYCCGLNSCSDYYYHRNVTNHFADPAEQARLQVGPALASASSPFFDQGTVFLSSSHSEFLYGNGGSDQYTSYFYGHDFGNRGGFSLNLALDSFALNALNSSQQLAFSVGAGTGDFYLTGLQLNLDAVTAVPEPESYVLLTAGLGLLGGWSMRRRRTRLALLH